LVSIPHPPPVPIIVPPHEQETWTEYHKGARYGVSILGVGVLMFFVLLMMIIILMTHLPFWQLLLIALGIFAALFWFLPRVQRMFGK